MHIPEGFLAAPVTATGAAVAVAGLTVCVRRARLTGEDGRLPLAGLAGAFFIVGDSPFVPLGFGTQGHLLGGTLAVALLGPWLGALTIAVVTILQALVQGDGGITTLGLNIVNSALVPAFLGWPILRGIQRAAQGLGGRGRPGPLALACGVAAFINVLLAASLFVVEYLVGAKVEIDRAALAGTTLGTYALVAVLEALLTAGIVRALLARRPDLVLIAPPELRRGRRRRRPVPAQAGGGPYVPPPPGCEPERPPRRPPDAGAASGTVRPSTPEATP
ncbi:energy-coupling factor ABC transporter permease [Patulibacter brassicae]|uniref:Energy-coupling factor ABC transporter permease n=1 Tax=Patulibacter brassicae TaxID=1705717 RepID=A0ABU4VKV3_9ACTN|nr:energy-coupling factor ABC transporter permease [Patulibacter brassicae]MDX8151561.1 energy-coupling factor ABC transporter permease [Patulibacter brassicae]